MFDLYSRCVTKICNSINNVPLLFRKDSCFGPAKSLYLRETKEGSRQVHKHRLGRGLGKTLGGSIFVVKQLRTWWEVGTVARQRVSRRKTPSFLFFFLFFFRFA